MPQDKYEYKIEDDNKTAVIKLKSNVLGGNDALIFQQLITELADTEVEKILIDMADVNIINSSGLGMLISGYSHLKNADKIMELKNVPSKVKALLEITKFNKIFNL